ncbi:hypothetical protein F0562_005511 [Nyssa sinensis]|uniref:non-specific serine/threonine protein kinase n=1 Tax=Nyssa sinensis TaxID=561372 RepID=A0A5J5AIH7_9ASTE|nr:hypothetical protein F0562_005511 [Nyssa sinensis]
METVHRELVDPGPIDGSVLYMQSTHRSNRIWEGQQICHRDLKLENTLLDGSPAPRLKICDFGYSKSSLLHSKPKSTVGTPAYIAPEVLSRREYDGKRITIKEIKSHPWFLKNLPRELTEAAQTKYYRKENPSFSLQSVEDIMKIVEEAKTPPPASRSIGGFGWGGEEDEGKEEDEEAKEEEEDEYEKRVKEAHESGEVPLS